MLRPGDTVLFRLVDGGLRPAICLSEGDSVGQRLIVFTDPQDGENRNIGGHSSMDGHTAVVTALQGNNAGEWNFPQMETVGEVRPLQSEEEPPEEPDAA